MNIVVQVDGVTIDSVVGEELAETIAAEKAKVVAAVRARAADLIAQAVKEGIGR